MVVTFLGTGTSQGVPMIGCKCKVCKSDDLRDKRLRSSVMININNKIFVIDTGPDFRQQMLRENVERLDAILFTHEHKDHTAGLDDIRAFNYFQKQAMNVFAEERVQQSLKQEYSYVFASEKYPGIPQIKFRSISTKPFIAEGIQIIPIRVMHHKLPILGFRIQDFTYLTDINQIATEEIIKIKGSKHIVISGLRKEPHISHFSLSESLELLKELEPERAYITHCSHQLGLYNDVQKELPKNVILAYDTLKITI